MLQRALTSARSISGEAVAFLVSFEITHQSDGQKRENNVVGDLISPGRGERYLVISDVDNVQHDAPAIPKGFTTCGHPPSSPVQSSIVREDGFRAADHTRAHNVET